MASVESKLNAIIAQDQQIQSVDVKNAISVKEDS
jgi:hypothetical protein